MTKENLKRYRQNLQKEIDSAAIYNSMADSESNPHIGEIYRKLAAAEIKHADFWKTKIRDITGKEETVSISWRGKAMRLFAKRFGSQSILSSLIAGEDNAASDYNKQPETIGTNIAADEDSHNKVLNIISQSSKKGMDGNSLLKLEGRHRNVGGNALRASVLGANDGLVSNLSLVMAVSGAQLTSHNILVTGIAGLLAGAASMAMGEWLSVQSSRELYQKEIETEAMELENSPLEEQEELSLIYQSKGIPKEMADSISANLMSDKDKALDTLAREELGIDPDELGGSAWEAAFVSFALFTMGAVIPVVPFMFLEGFIATIGSFVLSAFALFGIGSGISLITGKNIFIAGFRQVLFGLTAALLTYGVGTLIGVTLLN
jgi:vacuolar iron transporter family protein